MLVSSDYQLYIDVPAVWIPQIFSCLTTAEKLISNIKALFLIQNLEQLNLVRKGLQKNNNSRTKSYAT